MQLGDQRVQCSSSFCLYLSSTSQQHTLPQAAAGLLGVTHWQASRAVCQRKALTAIFAILQAPLHEEHNRLRQSIASTVKLLQARLIACPVCEYDARSAAEGWTSPAEQSVKRLTTIIAIRCVYGTAVPDQPFCFAGDPHQDAHHAEGPACRRFEGCCASCCPAESSHILCGSAGNLMSK